MNFIIKNIWITTSFVCPLMFFTDLTRNPYYTQIFLLNGAMCLLAVYYILKGSLQSSKIDILLIIFFIFATTTAVVSYILNPSYRIPVFNEAKRVWIFTLTNLLTVYILCLQLDKGSFNYREFTNTILFFIGWGLLWIIFFRPERVLEMSEIEKEALMQERFIKGFFIWMTGFTGLNLILKGEITLYRLLYVLTGSGFVASVYGLLQYFGYDPIWGLLNPYGGRPVSTFGNPNFISPYLAALIAVLYGIYITNKDFFTGFIILVYTAGLYATLTRSSWLGVLTGFLFFYLLYKKFFKEALIPISISLFLFFIFPKSPLAPQDGPNPATRITQPTKHSSYTQRFLIWSCAIDEFMDNPFTGVGWGLFELFYPFKQGKYLVFQWAKPLRTHANNAHNIILEFLSQTGIPGLTIVLLIFLTILRFFTNLKNSSAVAVAIGSGCIAFLADNIFNVSLFFSMPAFLFWFLLALSFKELNLIKPLRLKPYILIPVYLILFTEWFRNYIAEIYYFRGFKYSKIASGSEEIKTLEKARYYLEKSYRWRRYEVNNNYELANVYARIEKAKFKITGSPDRKLLEKSAFYYIEAMKANAGYDEIFFNLATVKYTLGELDDALKLYRTSLKINPLNKDAWLAAASIYRLKNDFMGGAEHLLEALKYHYEKDVLTNLAYFYSNFDTKKASVYYKKALEIDPHFIPAIEGLKNIK